MEHQGKASFGGPHDNGEDAPRAVIADTRHLVFIGETWAATDMIHRRVAGSARGLRLLAPAPHGL
jgi:hypothetical protein